MLSRRFAGTLKALGLILLPLLLCAGCWEEIRYTPPAKSAPPAATANTPQPTNGDAKAVQSPKGAADQKLP